jgi:predicted  nucleic acid-binding Zn-ribbon protein
MEQTVSQRLELVLKLQSVDSKLDELRKLRGDLPEEIRDLEDELAGFETRLTKYRNEIEVFNNEINLKKQDIKEAEKNIKKYEEQQMNVRNNREYDAITKEIELQNLEIQVLEKKIREAQARIEFVNKDINSTQDLLSERKKDLDNKKAELNVLLDESEEEESKLKKDREKASKLIEERLLKSYERLRGNYLNGLAVVLVRRDACGGCFNTVPPQRQAEIREKKKIIVCEHCGRILADVESVVIPEPVAKK